MHAAVNDMCMLAPIFLVENDRAGMIGKPHICVDFIECSRELRAGEIGRFRGINDHMEKRLLAFGALRGRLDFKECAVQVLCCRSANVAHLNVVVLAGI
ncbi:hypothetical protein ATO11_20775 [Pseudaestuariivita atlantica]|uniref:Uncharacterized protein n=1 Tax=Pseudaestuariivita atlantica TaxID=1317121 RepID=A0A0L1JJ59_9RHOB|nr:hypothetical protein ATO11_20775 [Pseudaestuariivita atlantica]